MVQSPSYKAVRNTSAVMLQVTRGEIKILMISVERLKNERFRLFIGRVPVSLLVIDEAHCIVSVKAMGCELLMFFH